MSPRAQVSSRPTRFIGAAQRGQKSWGAFTSRPSTLRPPTHRNPLELPVEGLVHPREPALDAEVALAALAPYGNSHTH